MLQWRVADSADRKLEVELAVLGGGKTHDLFICLCLKPESFWLAGLMIASEGDTYALLGWLSCASLASVFQ